MVGMGHNGGPVFQDRPYQTEAVQSLWDYFQANYGNPIVAMPTGTGKSVVIARFLESVFRAFTGQKVMILTHVEELIQQNYEKLITLWPFAPAGVYSAGLNQRDHLSAIIFAGIASVAKKWALFGKIDLILIDECHLLSPSEITMYQAFINGLKSINPKLKVIGFTATPWRMGHGHLTDPVVAKDGTETPSLFTDVCFDITGVAAFNRLIEEGYLSPLVPKKTKTQLDVDGVHMRGGEFIEKELQVAVDKDDITLAALKEAMELGHDRKKWLVFASGTHHADTITDMLNWLGIEAGCVHSKRGGRKQSIEDFKAGKIRALVNNNVLTTGFDVEDIDLIIVLRPTGSSILWVQMLGRGTRPVFGDKHLHDLNTIEGRLASRAAGGKENCLVLDYAGNTKRLGPINDPVIPRRKGQKGGTAPVKECPECQTWNHATLKYCGGKPHPTAMGCGYEFKFMTKLEMMAASEELIKGSLPVVEVFKVDYITYEKHEKDGSPDMMQVTYYSGSYNRFKETICFEHTNYAGVKARQWWKARANGAPYPLNTADALDVVDRVVPAATHIRVQMKKPWPEVMAACTDGTAFGTQSDGGYRPDIQPARRETATGKAAFYADLDDDIPF